MIKAISASLQRTVLTSAIVMYGMFMPFLGFVEAGPGTPFGGPRLLTLPCTCEIPGTFMITLTDYSNSAPKPLILKFSPVITDLRPFYNIFTSAFILGNFAPAPQPCMSGFPPFCFPLAITAGPILLMGTSQ